MLGLQQLHRPIVPFSAASVRGVKLDLSELSGLAYFRPSRSFTVASWPFWTAHESSVEPLFASRASGLTSPHPPRLFRYSLIAILGSPKERLPTILRVRGVGFDIFSAPTVAWLFHDGPALLQKRAAFGQSDQDYRG